MFTAHRLLLIRIWLYSKRKLTFHRASESFLFLFLMGTNGTEFKFITHTRLQIPFGKRLRRQRTYLWKNGTVNLHFFSTIYQDIGNTKWLTHRAHTWMPFTQRHVLYRETRIFFWARGGCNHTLAAHQVLSFSSQSAAPSLKSGARQPPPCFGFGRISRTFVLCERTAIFLKCQVDDKSRMRR